MIEKGYLKKYFDLVMSAFEKIPFENRQEISDSLLTLIVKMYDSREDHKNDGYSYPDSLDWFRWELREVFTWTKD